MRVIVSICLAGLLVGANVGLGWAEDKPADIAGQTPDAVIEFPWQVGYAQADITPKPGQAMMAGYGEERYAEGVLSPLRAQVLVFQDAAGRRVMLCTADVLGFGSDTVQVLRHRLQTTYGLPPSAVCFAASHTHWGPAINFRTDFAIGAPNVWYLAFLEEAIVRLAGEAIGNLAPARLCYGACDVQIGMNRRLPDKDGHVSFAPNPAGSYDRHTPIVQIRRKQSPRQLIVVGHACHPTSTGKVNKWSPDYPGAMRDRLEAKIDDCRAVFVMGCGGDAKTVVKNPKTGRDEFAARPDQSQAVGEKLADDVLRRLREKLIPLSATLQTTIARGTLSLEKPPTHREIVDLAMNGDLRSYLTWWARQSLACPDNRRTLDYEVQVWRLGPLTLVALEGEACADWGNMIRAMAPADQVMVVAYANWCSAYIPTARIIREGGYEGDAAHAVYCLPARFRPQMERELRELILDALGGVRRSQPANASSPKTTFINLPRPHSLSVCKTSAARQWSFA
jgi:neutral ceramidase